MLFKKDISFLFTTRFLRLFAYGSLSVILVLYLAELKFDAKIIGLILMLTLIGDALISLWLTTTADRIGRKKMLIIGAMLMLFAGVIFAFTNNIFLLIIAATIGVISPSGNEIGPFLSIEQASLTKLIPDEKRTQVFAWYNLTGSIATALGALVCGWLIAILKFKGYSTLFSYKIILIGYALFGILLAFVFLNLSKKIEVGSIKKNTKHVLGLHKSKKIVFKLSMLFSLDAFAGGFIIQSIMVYWFYLKFGFSESTLGTIFFGANILAGISALLAATIAKKIGLINTMVFTHLPSNVLLCLVPFMPNAALAITVLLIRFSISQMDVPTRQSYTMAVVSPDERSAASGITAIARSIGASISPGICGILLAVPALFISPFLISGGLKIVYDLLLYRSFQKTKPAEELKNKKNRKKREFKK